MKKVIILGLDGATFDLIKPWIKEGKLPNFRKIIKNGTHGELKSTLPPNTFPSWPSLFTGKNPGKLGVFDFVEVKNKKIKTNSSYDIKGYFLWELLERRKYKCGIINVPSSSPFRSKVTLGEGDQLRKDWMNFSWPEDTKAGIIPFNPNFGKRILEIIDIRFKQLDYILKERELDFIALVIYVIDPLQHFRWDDKKLLLEAYQKIDVGLGRLMAKFDHINLIIVSDHGMQTLKKWFYINNWLEKKGFLRFKKERPKEAIFSKAGINRENFEKLINPLLNIIYELKLQKYLIPILKKSYKKTIRALPPQKKIGTEKFLEILDWEKTKAYSITSKGGIFLNTLEREYNKVRERISYELQKYLEEKNHNVKIYKKEEIYSGSYLDKAPDLFLIIDDFKIMPSATYNLENLIFKKPEEKKETLAQHALNGIFMAYGPDIKKGKEIKGAEVIDITPTVLYMFNLPIPKDMDGRVLKEIFKKDSELGKREVVYEGEKEGRKIKEQIKKLKSMGRI